MLWNPGKDDCAAKRCRADERLVNRDVEQCGNALLCKSSSARRFPQPRGPKKPDPDPFEAVPCVVEVLPKFPELNYEPVEPDPDLAELVFVTPRAARSSLPNPTHKWRNPC